MAEKSTSSSSPMVSAGVAPGTLTRVSLSEKPPAQLNVKPVQLSAPGIGLQPSTSPVNVSSPKRTSQPPAIGQPLAMPKIEPVKGISAGGLRGSLSRGGSAQSAQSAQSAKTEELAAAKTFSAPENDDALARLKELRKVCVLSEIPVGAALAGFKRAAEQAGAAKQAAQASAIANSEEKDHGTAPAQEGDIAELDFALFEQTYKQICEEHGKAAPSQNIMKEVFALVDKDGNATIDMMELCSGMSMMCAGTEEEKIQSVFSCFDTDGNGLISPEEMFIFLSSVFKVVLTPAVMQSLVECGVEISGPEDLANVTTHECFKQADADGDGQLTVEEFSAWFYAPRNDPAFMFAPMRTLLE